MRPFGSGRISIKTTLIAVLAALLIMAAGPWSPTLAQTEAAPVQMEAEKAPGPAAPAIQFTDPFSPPLPAQSLKVRYRLSGRFIGQEIMLAKTTPQGTIRLNELRAVDTAFGLERPVHLWTLVTPEKVIQLDLVRGAKEVRVNLRAILTGLWKGLGQAAKLNLNRNLAQLGSLLGRGLKINPATSAEDTFLGLPTVKVALESGRIWYWAGTDLVLKETGAQDGLNWSKETIDLIQNVELPDHLFQLPLKDPEEGLAPSREEESRARILAARIIALLSRPLVGFKAAGTKTEKKAELPLLAVPWPSPAPPGFRSATARYRMTPDWRPYPPPPDQRPWPPPGLGQNLLQAGAESIAAFLEKDLPREKEDQGKGSHKPAQ